MRTETIGEGTPSKRARGANGFHVPDAVESAAKAGRRETPVRKRISVDGVHTPPLPPLPHKCMYASFEWRQLLRSKLQGCARCSFLVSLLIVRHERN